MVLNTEQIIKIKDTFSSLDTKKINQIQNIVKGNPKPKPQIQMMTKGPSREQVIILINGDNIAKFMKESSSHIANINRTLKNAKTEVLVNFIRLDQANITVVTNKIAIRIAGSGLSFFSSLFLFFSFYFCSYLLPYLLSFYSILSMQDQDQRRHESRDMRKILEG